MQKITWISATAASVAAIAFTTAIPALAGPVEFSVSTSLQVVTILTLIWTAAFTGESLWELRKARLADFEPVLDVVLPRRLLPFSSGGRLELRIRNLGKGAATDIRVRLWRREGHEDPEWFSTLLAFSDDALQEGESISLQTEISERELSFTTVARRLDPNRQEASPVAFVLEITYRDALRRNCLFRLPVSELPDPDTSDLVLQQLPESDCPNLAVGDRERSVGKYLEVYCGDMQGEADVDWDVHLTDSQFRVDVAVNGKEVSVFRAARWPASRVALDVAEFMHGQVSQSNPRPSPDGEEEKA